MSQEVTFNPNLNRTLFFGTVKDNDDPNLLERVRVVPEQERFHPNLKPNPKFLIEYQPSF